MKVGKTKDQGLYNKPLAAVHPGALAAGTLPQYNTIVYQMSEMYTTVNALLTARCNRMAYFGGTVCWGIVTWAIFTSSLRSSRALGF